MSTSKVYSSEEVAVNEDLRQRLVEILATSWTSAAETLDDELKRASHVICISTGERVMAFVSWRCEDIDTDQGNLSTGYMGIGAVSEEAKGQGLGKTVVLEGMIRCFLEAKGAHDLACFKDAKPHPLSPLIWGTTASSVSYLGLLNTFQILPKDKGVPVSPEVLSALRALYAHHELGALSEGEPFVLREKMSIRYTESEHKRLQAVSRKTPCPMLEGIDERRGDRLVMVLGSGVDGPQLRKGPLLTEIMKVE